VTGLGMAALFERRAGSVEPADKDLTGQCDGNPVQIGDGCATVTGDELPKATAPAGVGRRE